MLWGLSLSLHLSTLCNTPDISRFPEDSLPDFLVRTWTLVYLLAHALPTVSELSSLE